MPAVTWLAWVGALATLSLIFILLMFGKYTRQASADGIVIPRAGIIPVSAFGQGIITRILVTEGQTVQKGEPLLELELDRASATGTQEREIASILLIRRNFLQQTLQGRGDAFSAQRDDLDARISLATRRIESLESKVNIQRSRAKNAMQLYDKWAAEASGVLSKVQIAQQHDQALQQEALAIESEDQLLQYRQELSQLSGTRAQMDAAEAQLRAQLQQGLADATTSIVEHDIHQAEIIKAPVAGVVANIPAFVGQMVKDTPPPLLTLVPKGEDHLVEAWVDTSGVEAPLIGQTATITMGSTRLTDQHIPAKIIAASEAPLNADQIKSIRGINVDGPRYRVLLEAKEASGRASLAQARPGTTVSARVLFERTAIHEWLFSSK